MKDYITGINNCTSLIQQAFIKCLVKVLCLKQPKAKQCDFEMRYCQITKVGVLQWVIKDKSLCPWPLKDAVMETVTMLRDMLFSQLDFSDLC